MSRTATFWAVEAATSARLDATASWVLVVLAYHANEAGEAWPSINTLCDETRLRRTAVKEALRRIAQSEVVSVTRRTRQPALWKSFPHRSSNDPPLGRQTTHLGRQTARSRSSGDPEPIKEPVKEPRRLARPPVGSPATDGSEVFTDDRGTFLPGTGWVKSTPRNGRRQP